MAGAAPAIVLMGLLDGGRGGIGGSAIWRVQPSRRVEGWLNGVSCKSASWCIAVGDQYGGVLIERWNGKRWSMQAGAPTPVGSRLGSVSCTSRRACTAVGSFSPPESQEPFETLDERWDGRHWSIQNFSSLGIGAGSGVSCTSATDCTAVGGSLAGRWDGMRWTVQPLNFVEAGAELSAVSCASSVFCAAVGESSRNTTLAARWDGMSWTIESSPSLGSDVGLTGVSCVSAAACTAVGGVSALRWNGRRWFKQSTSRTSGDMLEAVSCVSRTSCTGVGYVGGEQAYFYPVAERWNGHRWLRQTTPDARLIQRT